MQTPFQRSAWKQLKTISVCVNFHLCNQLKHFWVHHTYCVEHLRIRVYMKYALASTFYSIDRNVFKNPKIDTNNMIELKRNLNCMGLSSQILTFITPDDNIFMMSNAQFSFATDFQENVSSVPAKSNYARAHFVITSLEFQS